MTSRFETAATAPSMNALFISFGSFSLANRSLIDALMKVRPDIAFETFDVSRALRGNVVAVARCLLGVAAEYGLGSFRSRALLRYRILHSRAFFRTTRRLIRARAAEGRFDLTLQTQSLFNASIEGAPNFVYTDFVATARDDVQWDEGVGRPTEDWLRDEAGIYADAAHVFVFGNRVRKRLIEHYGVPERRASAIGAGSLPARTVNTSTERYARRRILFVGLNWERKGGPELVAAFARLRARLPDVSLTIVGCSPDLDVERCEVLGRQPREKLDEIYQSASCFCMPSKLEPYGIVYAEAMHHGLPVIACQLGDTADMVEDGVSGRLVPPGDVDSLEEALFDILHDPERCRAFGLAGLERSKPFTWENVARKIAAQLPAPATAESTAESASRPAAAQ